MSTSPEPSPRAAAADGAGRAKRMVAKRIVRGAGLAALWTVLLATTLWATLAVYYTDLSSVRPRAVPAALFMIGAIAVVVFVRPRGYAVAILVLMFGAVLAWFISRAPSNDRQWAPGVARLAEVERRGPHLVTIHNVRNFDYRSEADFTPAWDVRTYDLDQLKSADLILSYWGAKAIAHAMVSFGFADGRHLAISIETRKERFESYSTVQGFFRQYELIYIFADERDLLRLRTNYRHEDVRLPLAAVAGPGAGGVRQLPRKRRVSSEKGRVVQRTDDELRHQRLAARPRRGRARVVVDGRPAQWVRGPAGVPQPPPGRWPAVRGVGTAQPHQRGRVPGRPSGSVGRSTPFTVSPSRSRFRFAVENRALQANSNAWSIYYNFDQYLFDPVKGSGRGVGVFGRFGVADDSVLPMKFFWSVGVGGKGIIPSRPNDNFGIGYYDLITSNASIPSRVGLEDEWGVEAFYNFAITPWALFTVDLQYVEGALPRGDDALVLGGRLKLRF